MMIKRSTILPFAFLLLTCLSEVYAQSTTATLNGTVVDANGAVIPAANVTLSSTATGFERKVTTNAEGSFTVPLLPPSNYTLTVNREGFAPAEIQNVILNVNDQRSLRIELKVGQVGAAVEVTTEASLIDESPAVSTTIDRTFVANLPLNGRSFQSLINLSPGVVTTKTSFRSQGQFSVNGQRPNANYFTVDGVGANFGVSVGSVNAQAGVGSVPASSTSGGTNNLVSVDALQEFKIQTSTYAPEFGRTPGAQVQIVTRGGTNDFHGTLFEYFRNDALDATDFFVNANRLTKPALRQNQFGGVFGGPLPLPRFGEGGSFFQSGKDRTFFFFSYEGLRLRLPQVASVDVPSLAARQNLSTPLAVRQLFNAFPIPNGRIDPATNLSEFTVSYSDPSTFNSTSLRIDHNFNAKLSVFGRYNYAPSNSVTRASFGASPNQLDTVILNTETLTGGATWVVSPIVSNEFRINWSKSEGRNFQDLDNLGGAVPPPGSLLFPTPFSQNDSRFSVTILSGRFPNFNFGRTGRNLQRQFNLIDNFSISTGSHQLRFGIDYRRLSPFNFPAIYSPFVLSDMNSFIAGRAQLVQISSQDPVGYIVKNFSAYGQDTWKASKRLTLTYGLRWELNPPPSPADANNPLYTVTGLDNPTSIALAPAGTPFYKTTYDNFAPRFGLAYQMSQHSGRETIIRGGLGIFYDLGSQGAGATITFPFLRQRTVSNVPYPLDPATAAIVPFSLNPPFSRLTVTEPDLRLPRTYQWNLTVEQSLGENQTFSAAYVGAIGRDLLQTDQLINPNANFQNVFVTRNTGRSNYHAMQLQFRRRLSRGFQALSSYTWSKSIDNVSNDVTDVVRAHGPSDFDVRHSFSAAVTYSVPKLKINPVVRFLLGGWAVDGIVTARSAAPFSLVARSSVNIGGVIQNIRPNVIPGIPIYVSDPTAPGGWIINNAAPTAAQVTAAGCVPLTATHAKGAFCTPLTGQGSLGRNAIRGFSVYQFDMAFRRQFNFTERFNAQLRAEFFNIFNHPNFADPVATLSSGLFGRSTQMLGRSLGSGGNAGGQNPLYQIGGPRSVQLVLKLNF